MSDKYIFRRTLRDEYTVVSNDLIRDRRLSWEARGLLIYLLSQKAEWRVRKTDLERQSKANDFAVTRILKELEELEYIFRDKVKDSEGRFDWITYVFDKPFSTIGQFPMDGEPPHIESNDTESNNTGEDMKEARRKRVEAAIREFESSARPDTTGFPADVGDYLEPFIVSFRREPAKQEVSGWIKTARQWIDMGVRPEQVSDMYNHALRDGLNVKSPASITYAFDAIRQNKEEPRRKPTEVF